MAKHKVNDGGGVPVVDEYVFIKWVTSMAYTDVVSAKKDLTHGENSGSMKGVSILNTVMICP
ncbi:hypothetical protein H072_11060 [Dactylellina haptotyla CBS 200.50]|uniref:Uncharacterized protein n=1 Tax=Dactylellina haptotyla (strain CBS 200.50) TaxID=1284197 RepID=S8A2X5_DACHA|nr:hypothetical protein H072_11060 [Dactylellina haptotyla CBS 200.50]